MGCATDIESLPLLLEGLPATFLRRRTGVRLEPVLEVRPVAWMDRSIEHWNPVPHLVRDNVGDADDNCTKHNGQTYEYSHFLSLFILASFDSI